MTDGAIGKQHITVPDLIDPIVGFRTMKYKPPTRIVKTADLMWREPNAYIIDKNGNLVPDQKVRESAYQRMMAEEALKRHKVLVNWQPALISPNQDFVWDRENTAMCSKGARIVGDHQAPEATCSCGLYCYYKPKIPHGLYADVVFAIVTVSGKVEAHTTGMRAQYMQVEHVFGTEDGVKVLTDKWGIPYQTINNDNVLMESTLCEAMINIASEYGSPMPESMKPKEGLPF